jgi:putative transposase
VARWAEKLQVSTSGYYDWQSGKEARAKRDEREKRLVRKIFKEGKGCYGADRIVGIIRERGGHMGRTKVSRHMTELGLSSIHTRRRSRSLTNSKKARGAGYPNILRNESFPIVPRMGLSSDITYLKSAEGFTYLCIIKDIVTGEILGRHMSDRMTKELVINAFLAMMARYRLEPGCIFHSDRGSQYTSKAFKEIVAMHGMCQSFSRVGMPGDNAWSESFFANMKKEKYHWQHYETRAQIKAAAFDYIEVFYNRQRAQRRLGYISPSQYYERLQIHELSQVA